jgi:hypothetical protein
VALPVGEVVLEAYPVNEETERRKGGPIIRTSTYKGLQSGISKVIVVDPYWQQFKGVKFLFMNYSHHVESGVGWVDVFGGVRGKQLVWSFPVHSIRKLD